MPFEPLIHYVGVSEVKQFVYMPIPHFLRIPFPAQYLRVLLIDNSKISTLPLYTELPGSYEP